VSGRHLVILADNDKAGQEHASKKAALTQTVAASIKIVEFLELPRGGDVSDYLQVNSVEDLQRRIAGSEIRTAGTDLVTSRRTVWERTTD
jgi:DNA primase